MFELASAWILVFLPLPWVIYYCFPIVSKAVYSALKVPNFDSMMLLFKHQKKPSQLKLRLLFFIWCLLLFAASGPCWITTVTPLPREGRNIMLVLDISGSMELPDMLWQGQRVSRLTVVKKTAEEFVKQRHGDRLGLILFGSRAYLQTPLTHDKQTLLYRLEDATVGLAGQTTSIGDAIGLAIKRLQNTPAKGRVIILLTDGVNNSGVLSPLKAAALAKLEKIKVYTIGLGSQLEGGIDNLFFTLNNAADLDEATLKKVASLTQARYFRATNTKTLAHIYQTINALETIRQDDVRIRPRHAYYPWPLGLAFLLFCFWLAKQLGFVSIEHFSNRFR